MERRNSPPGPPAGLLGIRLGRQFARDPLGFSLKLVEEFGPLVSLKFGPVQAYLAADPQAVHQVLVDKSKHFRKERRTKAAVQKMAGNGIIASEGKFWLRQRRMIQQGFGQERLVKYAEVIVDRTCRMLGHWPDSGTIDVCQEMTNLSLEIICKTMFQVDVTGNAASWAESAEVLSEAVVRELGAPIPIPDWLPIPSKLRKRRARRRLEGMMRSVIRDRRASGVDHGDMLSALLTAVDIEGDGGVMTDRQVLDECLTLLHAGYDSSAAGMTWCWYLLSQHPEMQTRAAEEVHQILGNRAATLEDYERLSFTRQVVQETLRLYPPAWMLMTRQAAQDTEIAGYPVRRGSWVFLIPWAMHRSQRWFASPQQFDPDRFSANRVDQIPPYAYFPFGMGPHLCIGEKLAMVEMTLAVATVLQRYRITSLRGQAPVEVEVHTAIRPRGGLLVDVTRLPNGDPIPEKSLAS